jgi:hypothetical protein
MKTLNKILIAKTAAGVEPLIKIIRGIEDIREEEVEKGPKFVEVILEWSTSQKKSVGRFEFSHNFGKLEYKNNLSLKRQPNRYNINNFTKELITFYYTVK